MDNKVLFNTFFENIDSVIFNDPVSSNLYNKYCNNIVNQIKKCFPSNKYNCISFEPNTDISSSMMIQLYTASQILNKKSCEIGFHGTDYKNIDSILKNGLIINCSRRANIFYNQGGQLFGPGHYFADDPYYPIINNYSKPHDNIYHVIVFVILTGNIQNYVSYSSETQNIIKQDHGFDSISSIINNKRCKIIYSDNQCIPIGILKCK